MCAPLEGITWALSGGLRESPLDFFENQIHRMENVVFIYISYEFLVASNRHSLYLAQPLTGTWQQTEVSHRDQGTAGAQEQTRTGIKATGNPKPPPFHPFFLCFLLFSVEQPLFSVHNLKKLGWHIYYLFHLFKSKNFPGPTSGQIPTPHLFCCISHPFFYSKALPS